MRELLHYEPDTGVFTWLVMRGKNRTQGMRAGCKRGDGYWIIRIGGVSYLAHRLALLYVHGRWPDHLVDHINGKPWDNRLANLREADYLLNVQNKTDLRSYGASGVLGVKVTAQGRFQARIGHKGEERCLGTYATAEEAQAVYLAAKRRLHEGCTI